MQSAWSTRRFRLPALLLAATVAAGSVWHFSSVAEEPSGARPQDASHAASLSRAFRDAAKAAIPTVVTIRVESKPKQSAPTMGEGENPFKGTPFENFFGENGRFPRFAPRRSGVGSGVIIDPSGTILTNNHVVEDADKITVELSDGREFEASDVKTDPQTDLAVLTIKASNLPHAKLGDSDKLQIGDWVIAIGNPFEQQNTVSAGIVSGTGRELSSSRARFIQTDAAINPGNSGGPLLNLEGEVVGINTAIASNSGGYQGIGFAIPVNTARWVQEQLVKKGSVDRAYLGVQIRDLDRDLAEQFAVSRNEGVLVSQVMPNTPAAEAGFQEGDIITSFAGKKVHEPRELQELVERIPFDTTQTVSVLREGKTVTLNVTVKPLPKDLAAAETTPSQESEPENKSFSSSKLGLDVSDLGAEEAKQLGYKDLTSGAVVTSVDPNGIAAEKGIREGMVIRRVGKTPVNNRADFEKAVKDVNPEDGVLLLVRSPQGQQFFVVLKGSK